jgi:phage baseplate assembly protein W
MAITPHFRLPFMLPTDGNRTAAPETEQGSADELFDCVQAIIRTAQGARIENPDFGITPQVFRQGDINLVQLQAEVLEWEPRANVVFESRIDEIDELVRLTAVYVHVGKTATGSEN